MIFQPKLIVGFILWASQYRESSGHGRLIEPPSRGSMWRYGFNSPPDYNDHELYCGGSTRQHRKNGGKCGVCGDPWDMPQPRPHEAGGKYGQGVVVRRYKIGQPMIIRVELTASHQGYFEFRLCPNNAPKREVSQTCLDKYVLRKYRAKDADDALPHETRFYVGTENKVYEMRYALPEGLTCSQCVLQWKYMSNNNWGVCENGTGTVGCGPQEEFRACADISVTDRDGATADTTPSPPTPEAVTTPASAVTTTASAVTTTASAVTTTADAAATTAASGGAEEPVETNEISDAYSDGRERPRDAASRFDLSVFVASIVLLSLGFVLVVFAFAYWYFYHAGDTVKSWWMRMAASSRVCARQGGDEKKRGKSEQPVPPPRAKKITIGFKGVPDNLV